MKVRRKNLLNANNNKFRMGNDEKELISFYKLPENILKQTQIFSFSNSRIPQEICRYQKKVFEKMELNIIQIHDDTIDHAMFLEKVLLSNETKEFIIFFDVDAIPLKKIAIFRLLSQMFHYNSVSGAVQTANHCNKGQNNYVGPFFLGIRKSMYSTLGKPPLHGDDKFDVGGRLTWEAEKMNVPIVYWIPSHVEVPLWKLYKIGYFGYGTTYDGMIYHAFEIRYGNYYRFIKKCKEVIASIEP